MEINVQKFQDAVLDGQFEQVQLRVTPDKLKEDGLAPWTGKLFKAISEAMRQDKLVQGQLTVEYPEPAVISIETGIINLPYDNVKKITNFLEPDEIVPVNLYVVVTSPYVNVSHLRIDEEATVADYLADETAHNTAINEAIYTKLDHIEAEMAKPKETVKEVPVTKKKPATKRRTTATKKTTTRRKKPAAKTTEPKKTTK